MPAPQPPLTVGVIGAGEVAAAHLRAWLGLGARVYVYSRRTPDALIERCGGGTAVASLDQLLDEVGVVDVCTPTASHADLVVAAAGAGCHVVCEKPLALTPVDAERMMTACAEASVELFPAQVARFFAANQTLQQAVRAGELGEVAVQRFTRLTKAPKQPWYHDDALSGGPTVDLSIHDVDLARWLAGDVATVFGRASEPVAESGVRSSQLVLTHDGGAISYVSGTWARPGTRFRSTYEVAGTAGLLRHDSAEHRPLTIDRGAAPTPATSSATPGEVITEDPYRAELREFSDALAEGRPARVTAADALAAVRIVDAARTSIRTGQPVSLTTAPAHTGADEPAGKDR